MPRISASLLARLDVLRHLWKGCRWCISDRLQRLDVSLTPLRQRPLLCFAAGLLSGSIIGTSVPLSPAGIASILVVTASLLCRGWSVPQIRYCCRWLTIGFLLTHVQVVWVQRALPTDHIARLVATQQVGPLTIEGRLERAVERRGDRQRLYLRLQRVRRQHSWQRLRGLVRLNVHADALPFLPGDVVRVKRLRLHPVRGFLNPGGFDFREVMSRQGIYAIGGVSNPKRVTLQHRPPGFHLARGLERWRLHLRRHIRAHLPAPYEAVFLAIVLGQRGELSSVIQQHFQAAGAAHLLVVSGLHVGFMAAAVLLGLRTLLRLVQSYLPRAWVRSWRPTPLAVLISLPVLLLYGSLVGWKVPTIRACVMVGSSLLALVLGRSRDLPQALVLAAAGILLLDPTAIFTLSFQLSFVAVAGILMAYHSRQEADEASRWRRWGRWLLSYVWISSAAYFSTLPIVAGAFNTLPTFGVLANLLLVPLASILVPLGGIVLAVTSLWPALGTVAYLPLLPLLSWAMSIAASIASLPGARLHLATPSVAMLLGYYALFASLILRPRRQWRLPLAGCSLVCLLLGLAWQYTQTRVPHLRVTFLDVGSGDAIVIQSPDQHTILIDGGGTYDGRFDIGARVVAPFLWDRYVRHINLMAMTHPHTNHARGLVSLMRLFPTRHLLTNGTPLTATYLRPLLTHSQRWRTQHHRAAHGPRTWRWGRLQLSVLAPPEAQEQRHTGWSPRTENDRSLVLRLRYGAIRMLFTGDIQRYTERWLLRHAPDLRADILQIPHHGSKTSTSAAFVRRVRPRVGIISLGAGNTYGHPHPSVLRVLASERVQVFRTDKHGAVTVTSDGTRYDITTFQPYRPPLSRARPPAR